MDIRTKEEVVELYCKNYGDIGCQMCEYLNTERCVLIWQKIRVQNNKEVAK